MQMLCCRVQATATVKFPVVQVTFFIPHPANSPPGRVPTGTTDEKEARPDPQTRLNIHNQIRFRAERLI